MAIAEAIPTVLTVWRFRAENEAGFTVREAKWVSRLSALFQQDILSTSQQNILSAPQKDIEMLYEAASSYARTELLSMVMNQPFDSTAIDRVLMCLPTNRELFSNIPAIYATLGLSSAQIRDDLQGAKRGKEIHWSDDTLKDIEKRMQTGRTASRKRKRKTDN